MADKKLTFREIAERINAHLKRFESDPEINKRANNGGPNLLPYYNSNAYYPGRGAYIVVSYVSYQSTTYLNRVEAEKYLQKLDTGFVGKHWRAIS
jgi:hypothetical protein